MKSFSILCSTILLLSMNPAQAKVLMLDLHEEFMVSTPLDYFGMNLEELNYKKTKENNL